jgi:hypothetical protein
MTFTAASWANLFAPTLTAAATLTTTPSAGAATTATTALTVALAATTWTGAALFLVHNCAERLPPRFGSDIPREILRRFLFPIPHIQHSFSRARDTTLRKLLQALLTYLLADHKL